MEKEIWKTIEEFPNYKVSNLGRIKNIRKDKLMTISVRKNGYCVVKLSNNGNSKECKVHRLVAKAFIPNPKEFPFGVLLYIIIHMELDVKNNQKKIKIPIKQCDMQGNIIKEFSSINEAAEELGILACNISNCLHGRQKSTPRNLYTWKF